MVKKFEYRMEKTPYNQEEYEIIDFLNIMGKDGWELCCIIQGRFVFKKEINYED